MLLCYYALQVKVFRPFFVSLDLPYSVIRGEVVSIPIVVFNYLNKDVTAEVTLSNEGEFEFADISNDVSDAPTKPGQFILYCMLFR